MQQQIVIWVLIILAGISGIYSFTTGRMFASTASTKYETNVQTETPYPTIAQDFTLPTSTPKEINVEGAAFVAKEQACEYAQDDLTLKLYSKMSNVRIDAVVKGKDPKKASIIVSTAASYIWDLDKKEGVKVVEDPTGLLAPDEILNIITTQLGTTPEAFQEGCKTEKVADTLFTEPKGITFSGMDDIGAMTKLIPNLGALGELF